MSGIALAIGLGQTIQVQKFNYIYADFDFEEQLLRSLPILLGAIAASGTALMTSTLVKRIVIFVIAMVTLCPLYLIVDLPSSGEPRTWFMLMMVTIAATTFLAVSMIRRAGWRLQVRFLQHSTKD